MGNVKMAPYRNRIDGRGPDSSGSGQALFDMVMNIQVPSVAADLVTF